MLVTIQGPNLRDDSKGTFHVHTAECGDNRHYGDAGKFGGEDSAWTVEVANFDEVVQDVYGDQLREGSDYDSCAADIWVAPCAESLA